jgi:hypothetical protein
VALLLAGDCEMEGGLNFVGSLGRTGIVGGDLVFLGNGRALKF